MFSWADLGSFLIDWLMTSGLRIVFVIIGTLILIRLLSTGVRKLEAFLTARAGGSTEQEKRIRTLTGLLRKIGWVGLILVAIAVVLSELGVDIKPIITAAGIGGVALGFGAQNLVRDLISGFFMLLEDQVRVGDVVVLNGTAGQVVDINLRTIVLRDLNGTVHIFPNGNIDSVSNMTKDWSRYVIDVGVAYKEDVDYVMEVLKEIGAELAADPEFGRHILEPLEVLGVDKFGASEVVIKVMITTAPLQQWYVGRELRRRIKKKFDELGIEIPFPHTTVYWGEASRPFSVRIERGKEKRKENNGPAGAG